MKKLFIGLMALSFFSFNSASAPQGLELGTPAPMQDYEMPAIDGEKYTLAKLKKANGLLVIFSCNTCPFVLAWEDKYPELAQIAEVNDLGMVLVNSNTKKRDGADSMEEMQKHFEEAGYKSPYVIDEENKLADAFGARTTPHVYLFDKDMQLVYRGSINNKFENKSKKADKFYLKDALKAMLTGEEIDPADTKEIGCSIKRI